MKTEEPKQKPKDDLGDKLRGLIASGVLAEQDVANALSRWVYAALMRGGEVGGGDVPQLVEAGILAAVAQACTEGGAYGSNLAQSRTTVRIAAALRIVGAVFEGKPERIAAIWNTANAWTEPADV